MCLRAQGIDDNDGGLVRGRRARGPSNYNRCISGGRGIYNASEGLDTNTEAAGDEQRV